MRNIYKIYTCSHTSHCVFSNIAATIILMKLGRVNKGNLQEKNMQGVAAELLFYSASFQRKIEEVVCIAEFVSKASPNIKEHKIYFKIAGIQLLSALS